MSAHDPALCGLAACEMCDVYGNGYAAGKAKAVSEIAGALSAGHGAGCGCTPCGVAVGMVRTLANAAALDSATAHGPDASDTRAARQVAIAVMGDGTIDRLISAGRYGAAIAQASELAASTVRTMTHRPDPTSRRTLAATVRTFNEFRPGPHSKGHLRDCAVPGCGASCVCPCHAGGLAR